MHVFFVWVSVCDSGCKIPLSVTEGRLMGADRERDWRELGKEQRVAGGCQVAGWLKVQSGSAKTPCCCRRIGIPAPFLSQPFFKPVPQHLDASARRETTILCKYLQVLQNPGCWTVLENTPRNQLTVWILTVLKMSLLHLYYDFIYCIPTRPDHGLHYSYLVPSSGISTVVVHILIWYRFYAFSDLNQPEWKAGIPPLLHSHPEDQNTYHILYETID